MPTEVEEIVGKLTDGQRKVLRTAEASPDGKVRVPVMLGNLNIVTGWPSRFIDPDPRSPYAELTELGLQVRAHLQRTKEQAALRTKDENDG